MSTLKVDTIQDTNAVEMYLCKAWVNFDGTWTSGNPIRASGNVSSITDNGTGDYTITFTNAMPDANYAVINGAYDWTTLGPASDTTAPYSTSAVRVISRLPNTAAGVDRVDNSIAIFR